MRKQLFLGVVTALGLCSSSAWATRTNKIAHLADDSSESGASGDAVFTYDDTTRTLCGKITYTALTGTPQELQLQASEGLGTTVSLVKAPAALTSPFTFSKVLSTDEATNTIQEDTPFVNLLTSTFPNTGAGELNGILVDPDDGVGTDACPVVDAGTDASTGTTTTTSSSSSTSSTSSSGSDLSGSSNPVDAGTSSSSSSGGCATVGDTNAASGLGLATIAGMGIALVLRGRRRR